MSEPCIKRAKSSYHWGNFTVARAEALPHTDKMFSMVVSCISLHHYNKAQEVFSEASRVLELGGMLYVIDRIPRNRFFQFIYNLDGCPEPYHFEKYCTQKNIEVLAQHAGLSVLSNRRLRIFSDIRVIALQKKS
jgi:ubiquinone/menaquinone biosynthesis C-methylase UbiE